MSQSKSHKDNESGPLGFYTDDLSTYPYLNQLDRDIFTILSGSNNKANMQDNNLLSYILRLLDLKHKRIDNISGNIVRQLDYNNIYLRKIKLPDCLQDNEHPLLILLSSGDLCPHLLITRAGTRELVRFEDAKKVVIPFDKWPKFDDTVYELHRSLSPNNKNIDSIIKLSYAGETNTFLILLFTSIIVLTLSLSIPLLTNFLVSSVLPESNLKLLIDSLIVVFIIMIASIVSQYMQELIILRLETISNLRLERGIWEYFLKLPSNFSTGLTRGEIYVALNSISQIRRYLGAGALKSLVSAIFSFGFLGLMMTYNFELSMWMSGFILIIIAIVFELGKRCIRINRSLFYIKGQISAMSYELSENALSIRSMGAEVGLLERWMDRNTQLANTALSLNLIEQSLNILLQSISQIGSIILFGVAVFQVLSSSEVAYDSAMVGKFIAFYTAFLAFSASISDAATNLKDIFGYIIVLWGNAKLIFDAEIETGWELNAPNPTVKGQISFRRTTIQLSGMRQSLIKDIDIDIDTGSIVSVCAKKASGKSLLLKTILGLIEPYEGKILIDSRPLKKISSRGYRRQVGYLPQEIILEPTTLRGLLGDDNEYSDFSIMAMLEKVNVASCVQALPYGLNTQLTKGGVQLSSLNRKRVALARALLRAPAILLLDEFLSGIPESEHQPLLDIIKMQGCTVIMIATTTLELQYSDQIFIVDKGRLDSLRGLNDQRLKDFAVDWTCQPGFAGRS